MQNKDTARILIVDDQIHALQGLSRIIGGAGYEVLAASNGQDCLKLAAEHKPDLILLDVVLPDIDGHEVCRLIKSNPETADIYVVLLSSIQVQSDSQAEALERGADGYIARPIPNRELVARVKSLLKLKNAENRLRESEARYRTVADFTYSWEYWVTPEGDFLYVSPSCERISGYSAEEFISDPDLMNRIIHLDDLTKMLDHYHKERQVISHAVDTMDFRIIRRDGAIRWIGHDCQPVYGQEGQPLGRRGSNRDITEHKQIAEEIKLNESRLQSLYCISQFRAKNVQELLDFTLEHAINLTGSAVGYIYHYDDDNRRFILNSWSKEVMKQCAVAEAQNVYELDKTGIWGEAVRQKKPIVVNDFKSFNPLKKGYPPEHVELFRFMTVPILHEDKVVAVVGVANKKSDYDDSDIRQLSLLMDSVWRMIENQRFAEQEKRLIQAIEQVAEAVIITDATGIIEYINPAEETISGYSHDELIGQKPSIFQSDKQDNSFYKNLWQTINAGNVWAGRFINTKKDGTEYYEDASISPVYDKSGNLTNFVAVKHDVTKQIELQAQLLQAQKMEAIGTLAGGFAHDFNNKLQVIAGYVDLMLFDKDLPETCKHDMGIIKQAVDSSAELIKGMMVFSRKTSVQLELLNLNSLVTRLRSLLVPIMPKDIGIDLVLADDIWTIKAAPNQIDQVLMNLAVNARDAMPDGGRLTIKTDNIMLDEEFCSAYPNTKPGRYALITVADTGAGMNRKTVSRIFEPFFTTKDKDKGTGLGLAIVYGIVEGHGGMIVCDSAPSLGTTFKIYFPAVEEIQEEKYSEKKEPPRGQGETILLVDDEPDLVQIVSRQLVSANYSVIRALKGKDALELYEKHREQISLVILDLLMPGMGGKQCLEALRKLDPNVRVLIASGAFKSEIEADLTEIGAKGFIGKPFDTAKLLEKIRKIIDEG
jgi:PAS domain S-box-containing protein